jgi:putative salt-induced outer membrane protein YdiY
MMPVTNKSGFFKNILLITLAIASGPLPADEVILKDGSRLRGEVVRQKDGVLEFKTAFAGVINVKWDQVSELLAEEPFDVFIDGTEVLQATAIRNDAEGATIESAGAPSRQVPAAGLISINPEEWERGDGYKLSGIVNAGLEFQEGNSDQEKIALDGSVRVRRQHDRLNIAAQYQKDKSNSVTTAKNWFLRNKYDYFVTDRRYWGGSLNFEHDRYADLELRTALGPHIGYQFFESKQMNLSADVALMYVMDQYYVAPDEEYAALGWDIDFDRMLLSDRLQFYHKQNGLFELGDDGNVVVHTWTGFRFPLVAGILASMEAQVDYDDGAPSGIDKVDTIYRAKLGYQW